MTAKTFPYSIELHRPGVSSHRLFFATFASRGRRINKLIKEHFVGRLEPYYWDAETDQWVFDYETAKSLWQAPSIDRSSMLEELSAQCLVLSQQKEDLSQEQLSELQESFDAFFALLFQREDVDSPF